MGRVKLEIKKIENPTNRQVTYSKRRNGLLKKAYELSVLCDIDIAVIMYSPSGKLTVQCRPETKIESILQRFAETPPQERAKRRNENLELLAKIVTRLSGEREAENHLYRVQVPGDWRPAVDQSELHPKPREIDDLRHLVEHAQPLDDVISARVQRSSSIAALDQIEDSLRSGLSQVRERKAALLENMRARQQFHQHMSAALPSSHPGECYQTGIPVAGCGEGLPQYFSADNNPYLQHLHQMQSPAFQQVNARDWQFKGKDVVGPESSGRDWQYKGKGVVGPESSGRDWQYKGKDDVGPESSGRDWQYKGEGVVGPESSGRDWQYKGEGVVGTGTSGRDWQLKVEGVVGPGTSNRDWQYKREGIVGQGTSNRDWQFKGEGAVGTGTSTVESDVFPGIQYELDPSIGYPNPTPPYC